MPRDGEPPSLLASVDRLMAQAHLAPASHVAVIGRHTLPFVLALLSHGCASVRSLRPDAAAPDCEAADLAWIVDVENDHELAEALRAARRRVGMNGCICLQRQACHVSAATVADCPAAAGLRVTEDFAGNCLLLTPRVSNPETAQTLQTHAFPRFVSDSATVSTQDYCAA